MDCQELIRYISEYLDHELDPLLMDEFDEHVASCPLCGPLYGSMKTTLKSFICSQETVMPKKVHQRLYRKIVYYSRTVKIKKIK